MGVLRAYMGTKVKTKEELPFSVQNGTEYLLALKVVCALNDSFRVERSFAIHFPAEP